MKTLLPIFLLVLLCASCARHNHYEDEYVRFNIPDSAEVEITDDVLSKVYNFDKEGDYRLSISEFEVGVNPIKAHFIAQLLGCPWIEDMDPVVDEIDGYPVVAYKGVIKGNYDIYTNTYIFSNGDKSVVLLESLKNDSTSWWKENLKWKMPKRTDVSLEERTENLEKLFNTLLHQNAGLNMQITTDNNNVRVKYTVSEDSDYEMQDEDDMKFDAWLLINCFDVFTEYADQKYDFFINFVDKSGNNLGELHFPYAEYSQFIDA